MVSTAWLIDGRGFADKVKSSGLPAEQQIKDCGAKIECPNCHYSIDNSDVSQDWPGLPLGVKFDPTDVELLKHLADKCGLGDSEPHKFIELFIKTIDEKDGICYAHPADLPGAKTDGSIVHFFYKVTKAYTTGTRKRRRITNNDENSDNNRWHKTGKTKLVMENGVHIGCKKILVLDGAKEKANKCSWVMHQYHLGTAKDEIEGNYVVSKIFYQTSKNGTSQVPTTPKTNMSDPPRSETTPASDYVSDDFAARFLVEDPENQETSYPSHCAQLKWKIDYSDMLAGESQAVDFQGSEFLQCTERYDPATTSGDLILKNAGDGDLQPETGACSTQVAANTSERYGWRSASCLGMLAGESEAVDYLHGSDFLQCTERYGADTTSGDLMPKNAGDLQPETDISSSQVAANTGDAANQGDANFDIAGFLDDSQTDFNFIDFSQDSLLEWLRF